ncbi:cell division protein FtsX [Desulfoglaeba alkanexedens]|uniref:Cell division protein FtsX n=1 Tax=Desulfoglaeba alkanexedens ALDC TaxID=980445 RepID=A0A4P8L2W0_9BACT|nr:ABC transporter permease [Desulfoglaeba alkanexedens]QCQ22179.1 ABC transporter permease [Desulfoglaeba alkanexedens ALDC]
MVIERFLFHLRRAVENLKVNLFATSLSVLTLALCLLLLGTFSVAFWAVRQWVPQWMAEAKAVAYLRDGVSDDRLHALARELERWPEVDSVVPVPREEAWRRLQERLDRWRDVFDGFESNPLPDSLEISFRPGAVTAEEMDGLVEKIEAIAEVEDVYSGSVWQRKIEGALHLIQVVGIALVALLFFATTLIVSNTVKLTVLARRNEIEVYSIVGATEGFIRLPFVLEGLLQGVMGGVLAAGPLTFALLAARRILPEPLAETLALGPQEILECLFGLLLVGVLLSCLGSWLALRRFLKV